MKYDPTTGAYSPDDLETAIKKAKRQTRHREKRAPLFAHAGLIEPITAQQVIDEQQQHLDWRNQQDQQTTAKADALREKVRRVVSTDIFAHLCNRRRIYPPESEWDCTYWFGCLVEYAPDIAQAECPHHASGYHNILEQEGKTYCPMCKKIFVTKPNQIEIDSGMIIIQSCDAEYANIGIHIFALGNGSITYRVIRLSDFVLGYHRMYCNETPDAEYSRILDEHRAEILETITQLNQPTDNR